MTDKMISTVLTQKMSPSTHPDSKNIFELFYVGKLNFEIGKNGEYKNEETWRRWQAYCLGFNSLILKTKE